MASIINIQGTESVDDPEYRYKMPRLLNKIEGRGNGIKTVVVNMSDISQSLYREPGEITKFFGCELGAQTNWNDDTEKSVVNGAHSERDMQSLLFRYIENFVLCKECRLPETGYKVKNGFVSQKCAACGAKTDVDMTHKLTAFILKSAQADKKEKKKKDKKSKKDKEKAKAAAEDGADGGGESSKKDKDKKEKKKKKKDKKKKGSSDGGNNSGGSDGFAEDDDEIATLSNLQIEDAQARDTAIQALKTFIASKLPPPPPPGEIPLPATDLPIDQIADEACRLQTFSALPTHDRIRIFVEASMDGNLCDKKLEAPTAGLKALTSFHIPVLKLLNPNNLKELQRRLLACIGTLCGLKYPDVLLKELSVLLKLCYDMDCLDEDVILEWFANGAIDEEFPLDGLPPSGGGAGGGVSNGSGEEGGKGDNSGDVYQKILAAAAPFVNWLKEAEDSDDDDDEEDEDEEEEEG